MSDGGRENTGSGFGCEPGRAVPSSNAAGSRDVTASPRRGGRPYVSLRSGARFDAVYRDGTRTRSGGIVVVRAPGVPGRPQVGFVAGRRVGNAVRRNRAKRRLRAAAGLVPLDSNTAYVVIASPEVLTAEFSRLTVWLSRAVGGREE